MTTMTNYKLYVSEDRCTMVRFWTTGQVEVCTREFEGAIWGPPTVVEVESEE